MSTYSIEKVENIWRVVGGGLVLELNAVTGSLARLSITGEKDFLWSSTPADVSVRDDLLRRTFDSRDLENVHFEAGDGRLQVTKSYIGAPWILQETYSIDAEVIHWQAEVSLPEGEFRSCAVQYDIAWPQPLYPVCFWTAREGMPSAPHRHAGISLEYGEVTSGTTMPVLSSYIPSENVGLLLAMPFDFRTARLRFISNYREPNLQTSFDWLALSPGKPARTSLLLKATEGNWRPALGWLYQRFREYFEPRSKTVHDLWGGHVSGRYDVSREEADVMVGLGLRWHEVHGHFPHYGNYHPEDVTPWRSGHYQQDETLITPETVHKTIDNLHAAGSAALLYMQLTGDGNEELMKQKFPDDLLRDYFGQHSSCWKTTLLMNSDPQLEYGKDMTRQIEGIVKRYPEMDGVFLDQAGYNFLDTGHDDGISAIDNKPVYLTGYNYLPHLQHLSALIHPDKSIIANAPFGIGMMPYIDGYMAEASDWLCDHLQYYGLEKPMFFLMYEATDRDVELMFQRCLIYGAGFTSYAKALESKDLYNRYIPLVEKFYRRRWVFDADPIGLPTGFTGNVFRKPDGSLVAGIVSTEPRLGRRSLPAATIQIRTEDSPDVKRVVLSTLDGGSEAVEFTIEDGAVQFQVSGGTVAAVAELKF